MGWGKVDGVGDGAVYGRVATRDVFFQGAAIKVIGIVAGVGLLVAM